MFHTYLPEYFSKNKQTNLAYLETRKSCIKDTFCNIVMVIFLVKYMYLERNIIFLN